MTAGPLSRAVLTALAVAAGLSVWCDGAYALDIRVRSEAMTIEESSGRVRFEGKVQVEAAEARMECDVLLLVPQGKDLRQVRSGVAEGNVVLTWRGDAVRAHRAEMDVVEERVELSGEPVLTRGGSSVRASRILYSLRDGTAAFTGPVEAFIVSPGAAAP